MKRRKSFVIVYFVRKKKKKTDAKSIHFKRGTHTYTSEKKIHVFFDDHATDAKMTTLFHEDEVIMLNKKGLIPFILDAPRKE